MYSIKKLQEIIEVKINEINFEPEPQGLYQPVKYILDIGGKRIRPALLLAACNVFSSDVTMAYNAAIGFEVFHNFTLLHDDVMDNSNLRRGNQTVHIKWDVNTAILSGDAMMIKAYDFIIRTSPETLVPVLSLFNKTALEVCEGQQFDMNFETRDVVTVDEYLLMIKLKTSVLIAAAIKAGAIIGGASSTDADLLYNFGLNLGIAFQLQDDLLDVYANTDIFGKQIGGDIIEGKKTFLMINAINLLESNLKEELFKLLNDNSIERKTKVRKVTEIYDMLNIKELTISKIDEYYQKAINYINQTSVNKSQLSVLLQLAEKIKVRSY